MKRKILFLTFCTLGLISAGANERNLKESIKKNCSFFKKHNLEGARADHYAEEIKECFSPVVLKHYVADSLINEKLQGSFENFLAFCFQKEDKPFLRMGERFGDLGCHYRLGEELVKEVPFVKFEAGSKSVRFETEDLFGKKARLRKRIRPAGDTGKDFRLKRNTLRVCNSAIVTLAKFQRNNQSKEKYEESPSPFFLFNGRVLLSSHRGDKITINEILVGQPQLMNSYEQGRSPSSFGATFETTVVGGVYEDEMYLQAENSCNLARETPALSELKKNNHAPVVSALSELDKAFSGVLTSQNVHKLPLSILKQCKDTIKKESPKAAKGLERFLELTASLSTKAKEIIPERRNEAVEK